MINSIVVTNHLQESLELELRHPEKSGIIINSIKGLGPPEANINAIDIATGDGSIYTNARAQFRTIVLDLSFMFDPTIEDVRQRTYKYFPIKKPLTLLINADNRKAEIFGYVKLNEPDIFSKDEGCTITIECPNPFFRSVDSDRVIFSGVDPLFEFPFSNESLVLPTIELGSIRNDTMQNVIYSGDEPVGVLISIHALGVIKNISIYNLDTRESMTINIDLIARDDLIISTTQNDKFITLIRAGVATNVINSLDKYSDWFKLTKGDNMFAYSAEEGEDFLLFDIQNHVLYEGV